MAFADDCSGLYGGRLLGHMLRNMQLVLNDLVAWGRTCGLEFNADKTIVILFSRRRVVPHFKLEMDGVEIPFSNSVKYLGVTLDSRLEWKQHLVEKIKKAKLLAVLLNKASAANYGPSPRLSRWAYTGIIRPGLTYAASCWAHEVASKTVITGLEKLERQALLSIAQVAPSAPTKGLGVIYDVTPIVKFIQLTALKTYVRLGQCFIMDWDGQAKTKRHSVSHRLYLCKLAADWGIESSRTDEIRDTVGSLLFRVNTDSLKGGKKHLRPSQFNLFTDGSRTRDGVGSGVVLYKHQTCIREESYRLPDEATVFMAEVVALTRAAELILEHRNELAIRFAKIHCDSQAALMAVNNRDVRSRAVMDAIESLNRASAEGVVITLVWIKAHVDYEGNERADALAKRGTTSESISETQLKPPKVCVINSIREAAAGAWAEDWRSYKHARQTKQFLPLPSPSISKLIYCLPRSKVTRLVACITGHGPFGYHQSLIEPSLDPLCRFCMTEPKETFHHLMFSCPALAQRRAELFGSYELPPDFGWEPSDVLDFIDNTRIAEIFELVGAERVDDSDPVITCVSGGSSNSNSSGSN